MAVVGTPLSLNLSTLTRVEHVSVDLEHSTVTFEHTTEAISEMVKKTLAKLRHPLLEEKNSLGTKAKSYMSCAKGKIGN